MSAERNIRDPIHGFVSVRGRELDVLDTPLFQRLRRIHQLAMARLVYPGALHTRFDHTLGVLYVAGCLCKQLGVDEHHTEINESMRDENLDCYAPLPECDEKKRRSIEEQMRQWFLSRLNDHFNLQPPPLMETKP